MWLKAKSKKETIKRQVEQSEIPHLRETKMQEIENIDRV